MTKKLSVFLSLFLTIMMVLSTCLAEAAAPLPKDDFYGAINAQWLATTELSAGMIATGGLVDLSVAINEKLMADFAQMLSGSKEPDNEELASFIEFYRLALDYEARDAAGATPLLPYLEMVESLSSLEEYAGQWVEWNLQGLPVPFGVFVKQDKKNADIYALHISTPGLFLPDKSHYQDEATRQALQGLHSQMCANLLMMAGKTEEEATLIVQQALAFDESLVPYARSAAEASDYTKEYNPMDFAAFDAQIEGFDLTSSFAGLLGAVPETIICTNPEYFAAFDELVNEDTFQNMKSWMLVLMVKNFAPVLSDAYRVEAGSFARAILGVTESSSREKEAYDLTADMFDEVIGIYYGKTYFGEQAKEDVTNMVHTLLATFERRLLANPWLSDETREMAIRKLNAMIIRVGYPDKTPSIYSLMRTVPAADGGTLVDNWVAFNRVLVQAMFSKWNTQVDRQEWPLSAHTVNAVYVPSENSINFLASILQAPFYSLEQSPSTNYGGIGAVIAHEISHAFDPNGAKYDEVGNLVDWWSPGDYAKFTELSQAMIDEFDGIPYAGGTVNGALTVGENVADAGGLSCALEAVKALEDVDLKAFFTSWASIWRWKATPEYEAIALAIDVHAPFSLRVNIQLQNIDDFYTTFDIQEGDGMYRAPEDRVKIW